MIVDADTVEACVFAADNERCEIEQRPTDRNSKSDTDTRHFTTFLVFPDNTVLARLHRVLAGRSGGNADRIRAGRLARRKAAIYCWRACDDYASLVEVTLRGSGWRVLQQISDE